MGGNTQEPDAVSYGLWGRGVVVNPGDRSCVPERLRTSFPPH